MTATLLYGDLESRPESPRVESGDLWLDVGDLASATGWELKPEGACRGEVCVPVPAARAAEFVAADRRRFNVSALARLLGQSAVRDQAHDIWAFGEGGAARREALESLQAPDFTLPDLSGRLHSLWDYLGKKIFLVSWASW